MDKQAIALRLSSLLPCWLLLSVSKWHRPLYFRFWINQLAAFQITYHYTGLLPFETHVPCSSLSEKVTRVHNDRLTLDNFFFPSPFLFHFAPHPHPSHICWHLGDSCDLDHGRHVPRYLDLVGDRHEISVLSELHQDIFKKIKLSIGTTNF